MANFLTTSTRVTKIHRAGCASSAARATEKNKTFSHSNTAVTFTTGRSGRFPWGLNFSYGMMKNTLRIWEYRWKCKIWR